MKNQTNNMLINGWSWLMHRVIWAIVHWYLAKKWEKLGVNSELKSVYDHIINIYETEWKESGLFGVLALRRRVRDQINELSVATFLNNQASGKGSKKDYAGLNFNEAFKDLAVFKDIFAKVVWTVETLSALRRVLSFIVNILTIPVFVFHIWLLVRKVIYGLGFITSGSLGLMYYSNFTDWGWWPISKDESSEESYVNNVIRSIQKGLKSTMEWFKSFLEEPSVKDEIKPVDILPPKSPTHNKWIPSWFFDDEGVNKYIWYTGIAITIVALIGVICWGWGSDSDGSSKAAGIGATIWGILPEGVQNYFSGWNWSWNWSREDKGKGPLFPPSEEGSRPSSDRGWFEHYFRSKDTPPSPEQIAANSGSPMIASGRPAGYSYEPYGASSTKIAELDIADSFAVDSAESSPKKTPTIYSNPIPLDLENPFSGDVDPRTIIATFAQKSRELNDMHDRYSNVGARDIPEDALPAIKKVQNEYVEARMRAINAGLIRPLCLHAIYADDDSDGPCTHPDCHSTTTINGPATSTSNKDNATSIAAKGLAKLFRK